MARFRSLSLLAVFSLAISAHALQEGGAQDPQASKTAKFGSVSASSPGVKNALDSKNLQAGLKLTGKTGSFTGTVVSAFSPRSGNAVYLDFSKPYDNSISGKVSKESFAKFPKLSSLKGKRVLVSGKFFAYKGTHPEVEITDPSQVKLVK